MAKEIRLTDALEWFSLAVMTATAVKQLRRRLQWTQKKFATRIGVTVRTVQNWETKGCPQGPTVMVLKTLDQ